MRVLEKIDENTEILYMRMKIPMCSDRDMILQNVVKNLEDDTQYFHLVTVEHKDMPVIKGVIRMFSQINGYVTKHPTIENCYKYTEINYMDMKGRIPKRLLSMVIAGESAKEVKNLYNTIRLDKKK
jgi:aspartyl/asparaginyl beta-hydroxylase (cupin superfamily)